ncbi:globin-coupled sensor protein [Bosea sp. (in: a-proteobacteria)]|uniref:globin-coupled sensor protein n=1 Tax=Bosea sp. (in: a-proteobacteria) TaxID=1871050 RepID=UPI002736D698|nr:globin-coupled sensor protein [Bosea sp. (in: a-proteobacteria)]MDP3408470.1 methyl-accepting chemotaxis protein [Bosea sp. (in: a-proteobacteria)]
MSSDHLTSRLAFMQLDSKSRDRIKGMHDEIVAALPGALDAFYSQLRTYPETKRFFSSETQIDGAAQRQSSHWDRIAKGEFDQNYVAAVTKVGEIHARIGLEPRWYIGGYALILERIISDVLEARWPKSRFGGKIAGASDRAAEISALVKAALLDMDYAISVYLEASEAARLKSEERAKVAERVLTAEREKAVKSVSEGMAALAKGDLTFRIGQDIPQEYSTIRDNFNEAMGRLEQMVTTIKTSSAAIAASSQEINSGAEDLSLRTEQQASALEESAATTEQLAASVKTSAQASRRSVALADDATKIARTGGDIVKNATDAMARIEEASKKISEITSVIDGIAFQTNLLALNAAVEAARAGDAGRGFAVVAAEVRALAQRSSDAAKDITGLIASSDAEVTEGVKLVREAGGTLEQIVEASAAVSNTVQEIASASAEQAGGIDEMSQTVSHMDEITQQNAALAEQSAASAKTLLDQIEQLNRLISTFRTQDSRVVTMPAARRAA